MVSKAFYKLSTWELYVWDMKIDFNVSHVWPSTFSRRGGDVRGGQHNVSLLHKRYCVEVYFELFVLAYTMVSIEKSFFILNSHIKFRFSFAFFFINLCYHSNIPRESFKTKYKFVTSFLYFKIPLTLPKNKHFHCSFYITHFVHLEHCIYNCMWDWMLVLLEALNSSGNWHLCFL